MKYNDKGNLKLGLQELTDMLEAGIRDIFASDKYREMLAVMSKFHDYSVNNTMLIAMQKPDATEAQKSSDLYLKCQYLDEITGGKGCIFATGTPISNSMTEMYTMMRYLQAAKLAEMDMQNFDAWAATFGEKVTAIELAPEGTGYRAIMSMCR